MGEYKGVVGGVESMMSSRFTPWHGLSDLKVRVEHDPSPHEALALAGIDWSVSLAPVHACVGETFVESEDHNAVVRDFDRAVLGIHSKRYGLLQNDTLAELAEAIKSVESGLVQIESAGALFGGKVVWMLARMGEDKTFLGWDERLQRYLLLCTSHDGSYGLCAKPTDVRVECMNTFAMAAPGVRSTISIRHTTKAEDYIPEAKRVLSEHYNYQHKADQEIERLLSEGFSVPEYQDVLVPALVGDAPDEDGRSKTLWEKRRDGLAEAILGPSVTNIKGTKWGAMMAVNEWELWEQPTRGQRLERQAQRFLSDDFPLTRKAHALLNQGA